MKRYIKMLTLCLMLFCSAQAFAQNKVVKGTVVDETGVPVIGATVRVQGTKSATVTDLDGNYTISVPNSEKILISYIGYEDALTTGGKIQLASTNKELNEVVVVGYGTQKKSHLTGSVETVPMEAVQDISTGNLSTALRGLVNGISVSGGEARPGEQASIYVRNADDMGAIGVKAQQPLYVIDGFILDATAFNNLDASSIESISVLKDAAAAVYGARAANGVILVTTKRGKLGAPTITYSGTVGFTDAVSKPKMLSAYQYGQLWNATRMADQSETDIKPQYDLFQMDELNAMKNLNYDLLDKYWKTAMTQQHSINLSGATDRANYFADVSYFTQDGNLGKLDYDRWNFRAGVDVKVSNWWKASLNVSGDYGKRNQPLMKVQGSSANKDYVSLLTHPQYVPESINGYPMANYGITNTEYYAQQDYNYEYLQNSNDYTRNMTANTYINGSMEYDFGWSKLLKGLKMRVNYSKAISTSKSNEFGTSFNVYKLTTRSGSGEHLYTPISGQEDVYNNQILASDNFQLGHNNAAVSNGTDGGYLQRVMDRSDNYQLNFTATYDRDFGLHHLHALFSIEKSEYESEDLLGQGTKPYVFSTGQSNSINTTDGGITSSSWGRSESGTLSYVGRVNYDYADRYLLEFLLRSDASTKFAPENYWGYFPSVSAGWVMSEESWMRNAKWLNFLKLRASYGLTGRDNIAAWQWMQTYSIASDKGAVIGYNGPAGSHIAVGNASVNRNVHWDKSYKFNFGIDFGVLQNRLTGSLDTYYVWDRDMLLSWSGSVPSTVGTSSASQNYGKMDSYGVELSLNWRDKIGKDFKYRIGLNTGLSDNQVLLMDWPTANLYRSITKGSRTDMGTWGMQCLGMFRSYQDIEEYFSQYNITSYMGMTKDQIRPGMLIYKDVRGPQVTDANGKTSNLGPDGIVDTDNDLVQLSNRSNPYGVTMNLGADYKDFSITAQLNASWGGYSTIPSSALTPSDGTNSGYKTLEWVNMPSFWNADNMFVYSDIKDAQGNVTVAQNRDAYYPNMRFANVNSVTSTFWRVSGTRVALNRLTLAYKLPKIMTNWIGIQSARLNVTGQNLLSLYNPYPNHFIDPMMGYGVYPTLRKFTVGLNITF